MDVRELTGVQLGPALLFGCGESTPGTAGRSAGLPADTAQEAGQGQRKPKCEALSQWIHN